MHKSVKSVKFVKSVNFTRLYMIMLILCIVTINKLDDGTYNAYTVSIRLNFKEQDMQKHCDRMNKEALLQPMIAQLAQFADVHVHRYMWTYMYDNTMRTVITVEPTEYFTYDSFDSRTDEYKYDEESIIIHWIQALLLWKLRASAVLVQVDPSHVLIERNSVYTDIIFVFKW